MVSNFYKKTILLASLVFISLYGGTVFAVDIVDSGVVTVSARVIDPNIVITPTPDNGGNVYIPKIGVSFTGEAYPYALVFILKGGQEIVSVAADKNGYFNATLEEKYDSTILYTLYAKDISGNKSLLLNYPVAVYTGYITELKNIRFAPTIVTDKTEVAYGDYLTVSGYSMPDRDLQIIIKGNTEKLFVLNSDTRGFYTLTVPLTALSKGSYTVYTKYLNDDRISKLLRFSIGEVNRFTKESLISLPGDCNKDDAINLVDFSILAFWYKKQGPPRCVDVNQDATVDLIDFSILAFYWTG